MGKGGRTMPMPRRLIDALRVQLRVRPAPLTLETAPADTSLIAPLVTSEAPHPYAVGRLFRGIFARAADQLALTYPNAAAELSRASTHWLGHTFANHGLDAGADICDMQELLGHASLGTTTLYTKADVVRQFQLVEALFNAALDGADPPPSVALSQTASPAISTLLVDAGAAVRRVDVHVTLRVEPKRVGGRGWARTRRAQPDHYGVTVLQVATTGMCLPLVLARSIASALRTRAWRAVHAS